MNASESIAFGAAAAKLKNDRRQLCEQLPRSMKQQITAQMALVGWRFPSVERYSGAQVTVEQFTLISPIGEAFHYYLDLIEDAGVWAWCIWNDKGQAMRTGRKLEDFE